MIPAYVAELRSFVGPDHRLWLPGVNAVVLDEERVLLHRRSDTGDWSILSGILDPGEEPAAGVVREVAEETGIRVVVERLAGVTVSPPVVHTNGHRAQYLELVFACRPDGRGQVARAADDESLEVGWFLVDALPPMRARTGELLRLGLEERERAWFRPG
ncbi:NUDIX hydrolase [Streptomyces diastaticus]|uniref:NUDIX hydrolase n=1 Tax=Streptomyces diastaticus subsp. diastaticus TaxID=68040 RepID=A0ABQ1CRU0_STRDI|nr:NUDIX domain-containing protein [Streptomyces diastaticus]GFH72830.1 NUDIX hydrolase [Streptomyces diastaticus subsp. diastaticus]GGU43188.1 NUDIX hydrolase [Streptomyces diastaticus subsp. diastaticus]